MSARAALSLPEAFHDYLAPPSKVAPFFYLPYAGAMLSDLAQDRRTVDTDGRLHVPGCRISKANVCPYLGREIPGWQQLGLSADRVYNLYRTPELLRAAADSFNNVPLMLEHVPVSADAPQAELIAGTVSNARYDHPYLVADVAAWTREAIDGIVSDERRELSCAYRYVPSMIAGTSPDGVRYDGRMEPPPPKIGAANHVALVAEGRAGPDVTVADGAPRMSNFRYPKIMGALAAVLATATPEQLVAMDTALDAELKGPKCVADEFPDLSAEDRAAAMDNARKSLGREELTDAEERDAYQRAAADAAVKKAAGLPPHGPQGGAPDPNPVATGSTAADEAIRLAVDAALVAERAEKAGWLSPDDAQKLATDAATAARADVHALYAARADVEPKVGDVALDSAEAVYRFALDKLGVTHAELPAAALAPLFAGVKNAPVQDGAPPRKAPFRMTDVLSPLS
jgi:uncharacterized protein